jgi:hypothetical protein
MSRFEQSNNWVSVAYTKCIVIPSHPETSHFFTPGYSFGVLILILDQNHQKDFHKG